MTSLIPSSHYRILVVDDDATLRSIISVFLSKYGHEVRVADSGEAAIAACEESLPDIVLMDVVMPGIGGLEATRQIKAMSGRRWVPIILISALTDDEDLVLGLSAGGDDYLFKPLKLRLLQHKLAKVEQLLAERQQLNDAITQLRLNASVFDTSLDGIVITDAHRRILNANPSYCEITGFSLEELIGETPAHLSSGLTPGTVYADMWQSLRTSNHWRGEVTNRHKNGDVYQEQLSISAVRDDSGEVTSYVGIINRINTLRDDIITGLPSRQILGDRLHQAIEQSRRNKTSLACLVLGLDRFSAINASLGHATGDLVLREVARRLRGGIRASDTLIRSGGDEFTLLIGDLRESLWIDGLVRYVLHSLAQPYVIGSENIHLSASAGVAFHTDDIARSGDLLQHAEMALSAAKAQGGNRCEYFQSSMRAEVLERRQLTEDLRQALEYDQFILLFQPVVCLKTDQIRKAEALIRWQHPQRGLVSPMMFIKLAEQTGLIHDIGQWVMRQAIAALPALRQRAPDFQISVNVSPAQFQAPTFSVETHQRDLDALGLPGSTLVLEITEGLLLDGNDEVKLRLKACQDAGIQVAIDDFGTGYSSLSYLHQFATDYLKIDQSFVRRLTPGGRDLALCEAIIGMGHSLGLSVVAEGIETEEQRSLLTQAGCDFAQGYLYGRPMPLPELLAMLQDTKGQPATLAGPGALEESHGVGPLPLTA